MSFNYSTRFYPNIIFKMNELGRFLRHYNASNEFLNHTTPASKIILAQKPEIMDAWTQALKACDGEYISSVDWDIPGDEEELKLEREQTQTMRDTTEEFILFTEIQAMIWAQMERLKFHCRASVLIEILKERLIDTLQRRYDAVEEGLNTPLFNLAEVKFILLNMKRSNGCLWRTSNPSPNLEAYDHIPMRNWQIPVAGYPMMANAKRHINKIEEEHCSAQHLQQDFFETRWPRPRWNLG